MVCDIFFGGAVELLRWSNSPPANPNSEIPDRMGFILYRIILENGILNKFELTNIFGLMRRSGANG